MSQKPSQTYVQGLVREVEIFEKLLSNQLRKTISAAQKHNYTNQQQPIMFRPTNFHSKNNDNIVTIADKSYCEIAVL